MENCNCKIEGFETEGFMVEGVFMEGCEIKFKPLFEELFKRKEGFEALMLDGDAFGYTRWQDFIKDSFFSQLERLSRTHGGEDDAFIGEYVVEFFIALMDDQKFSV